MLTVNLCGQPIPTNKSALGYLHAHHLFINKIPNSYQILTNQPFPNSIWCLLQSVELTPQTVKDSLDEEEPEKEAEVKLYSVNYLVNACGLSEGEAIKVAKRLIWKNKRLWELNRTENADAVLDLLREYGFSRAHISMAVKKHPLILMARPYDTIMPKLDFLRSIGPKQQGAYLGEIVSQSSQILATSLKRKLIPNYKILKEVFDSNHDLIHATLKKGLGIMQDDLSRTLVPNVEVLKDAGVSKSRIHYLVVNYPLTVREKHSKFRQAVIQLKDMDFDPSRVNFIYGLIALLRRNKDVWDRSFEIYLKLGCTRDEIVSAFRIHPFCMLVSEEKINKVIDCLVNEMGWPYDDIINKPHIFKFSLEKRIIPRCSVVLFLHSKGYLEKLPKLAFTLEVSVNYFINRYVTRYVVDVPEVQQIYKRELNFLGK